MGFKRFGIDKGEVIMQIYENNGGNSGVVAFSIGNDYIEVQFKGNPKTYKYSYKSAGIDKVECMKKLALDGKGLNSYIMRYAKDDFEK